MGKPFLNVLRFERLSIFDQLQFEEALFRLDERNWLILNEGTSPAIVLGISSQVDKLIDRNVLQANPLPLIRRFSGGGTVVVDEETLFVTLICQQDALDIEPYPRHIMEWNAKLYTSLLPQGRFSLKENDYTFDELKWGGNAQSIRKGRWLHHSSLLWDYDPQKMSYLLMPEKVPEYRLRRSHSDFLCRLKDHCAKKSTFQDQILEKLTENFQIVLGCIEAVEALKNQPHRRATKIIT